MRWMKLEDLPARSHVVRFGLEYATLWRSRIATHVAVAALIHPDVVDTVVCGPLKVCPVDRLKTVRHVEVGNLEVSFIWMHATTHQSDMSIRRV